ncbi:MAG: ATP-binding cassette domain-containing protein [Azospirillum sp.]|nr:ATP-binding cassette domain-containing protein [Azospirillum sp.]
MAEIVRLDGLTLGYEHHPAVHHLTGGFAEGSLTAVVGPNGAGKSTLIKGIMGLLRPLSGRVSRRGLVPGDIAWLPQQAEIDRSFPITVLDTVLLGLWRRTGGLGAVTPALHAAARDALAAVGLAGFERRVIGTLSAGQTQRVLFARLLVQESRLILLDEPFAAVDARTTTDLLALVRRWHDEGRTVIAVLHDLDQVRRHFPDCLLLARELIGWGPTAEVATPALLARARAMAEAWDNNADWCRRGAAA